MLKARSFVVVGFMAITLFFGISIAKSAVQMADHVKSHVQVAASQY